jgi:hypothetical protein
MKRLFAVAGALALAAMLSACAGAGDAEAPQLPTSIDTFRDKVDAAEGSIAEFAQADVSAALADAEAHDDVIAAQCYRFVLTVLPALVQNAQNHDIVGPVSTFQKGRNLIKRGQEGISDELTLNCGPLYLDAKRDIKSIPGMIAGLASKLGVRAFLPI